MNSILTQLQQLVTDAMTAHDVPTEGPLHFEHPKETQFGDYSTNVALTVWKQSSFPNPRAFATALVEHMQQQLTQTSTAHVVREVTVAGPGFINFMLSDSYFIQQLTQPIDASTTAAAPTQKMIVEYMQPNTNKPLHIGHLRNAILGWSVIEVLRAAGNQVIPATINNDRGLHIVKSMWGYLFMGKGEVSRDQVLSGQGEWTTLLQEWMTHPQAWIQPTAMTEERLQKPDHFVGHWYVQGDAYAEEPAVQKTWQEMLIAWEQSEDRNHPNVRAIWKQMNDWFYEGYHQSQARLGFTFDPEHVSYESDIYEAGRQIILKGVEQGLFEKLDNGAVQAKLEKFNLPDKILLRKDGTGIYMTFDIELTRQRSEQDVDRLIWVVGNDQKLYFQQLFAISQLLGYGNQDKFYHFSYGMVRLPEGKMSSRKGRVLYADDVIDLAVERAHAIMQETGMAERMSSDQLHETAEKVGMAAIKWATLIQDPLSEITFDVEKSVSFQGNSGPYLQYTYARAKSVLRKAEAAGVKLAAALQAKELNPEELAVARLLTQFSEVTERAAQEYAPHHVANYLFELAQAFNTFYNQHSILGTAEHPNDEQTVQLRLLITQVTAKTVAAGLQLLGIETVEQM